MQRPILYRKKIIPDECLKLTEDTLIYQDSSVLVTTWRTIRPKKSLHHGMSCYFLRKSWKVSKFYDHDNLLAVIYRNNFIGFDVCKKIKQGSDIPVIFLTACDDEGSVVLGLDMGADDYVTKPFRIRELLSRINSVLRRSGQREQRESFYQCGPIRLYPDRAKVFKGEEEIALTALEYRILLTFLQNPGQVLTRNQLLESIWDMGGEFVNDNTLTVYIKRLREKLEEDKADPAYILTVRGMGYRINDEFMEK